MVATTIMENGIDIPNVNTIVVQDTQLFGLGQLHQVSMYIYMCTHVYVYIYVYVSIPAFIKKTSFTWDLFQAPKKTVGPDNKKTVTNQAKYSW